MASPSLRVGQSRLWLAISTVAQPTVNPVFMVSVYWPERGLYRLHHEHTVGGSCVAGQQLGVGAW